MALRQAGLIFRAEAAASLVITPRVGEGFIVRRIFAANVSATPPEANRLWLAKKSGISLATDRECEMPAIDNFPLWIGRNPTQAGP